jgi:hypothetical protein
MNFYRIIGGDGKEYGPISADQLRQWIAENRANALTQIRLEGETEWRSLSSFPEFSDALGQKQFSAQAPPIGSAPVPVAELIATDYTLDIGECVSAGWGLIQNRFGLVVGGSAVYMLIQAGLGGIGNIPILGAVVTLINYVFISGPMLAGLYYFLLKVLRNQPAEVGDIFTGFRVNYFQLVLAYVLMMLLATLVAVPGGAAAAFAIFQMIRQHDVDSFHLIVAVLGFLVAIVPAAYVSISYMFSLPLVIDRGMGFWDAMELSRKQVGKHWWTVFALLVVCGLIQVAGFCACCVGIVVSTPVAFGAMMCAYERIFAYKRALQT